MSRDQSSTWLGSLYGLCFTLLLALAAASSSGCSPLLATQSAAPPGRAARLDEVNGFWGLKRYNLEISEGVAIAMTCYRGGPCATMSVVSSDPGIAEVRRASLGKLEQVSYTNANTASAIVIVGKKAGTTKVKVTSGKRSRDVIVRVIAPPGPISVQATGSTAAN